MAKIHLRPILYLWIQQRVRSISAGFSAYSTMFLIGYYLLAAAIMLIISLIPVFLYQYFTPSGDIYCINNYTMTVAFQIPIYTTTVVVTMSTNTPFVFYGLTANTSYAPACADTYSIGLLQSVTTSTVCNITTTSDISPNSNGKVLNSYALSDACYRALQSCYSDPELTACLLSGCVVVGLGSSSGTSSYTNYQLMCNAKIYYSTRCADAAVNSGLYYSSAQPNSACRQQRLNRINACLNSTQQLSDVPCMITVSSGYVNSSVALCYQNASIGLVGLSFFTFSGTIQPAAVPVGTDIVQNQLSTAFTTRTFAASDDQDGHAYKITSINSQYYSSSQPGALYCGGITRTQIATTTQAYLDSQSAPI